jgi:hypothetical protein
MHKFSYLIPVISALCEILCTLPSFSGMRDMSLHKSCHYSKNYTNTLNSLNEASVAKKKKITSIPRVSKKAAGDTYFSDYIIVQETHAYYLMCVRVCVDGGSTPPHHDILFFSHQ